MYLIGLKENSDTNPLSSRYGQVKSSSPISLRPTITIKAEPFSADFFNELVSHLKDWIREQRWFLEKAAALTQLVLVDYFEIAQLSYEHRSFGIIGAADFEGVSGAETHTYYFPLSFFASKEEVENGIEDLIPIHAGSRELVAVPGEHNSLYQKGVMGHLAANNRINTSRNNVAVFKSDSSWQILSRGGAGGSLQPPEMTRRTGPTRRRPRSRRASG